MTREENEKKNPQEQHFINTHLNHVTKKNNNPEKKKNKLPKNRNERDRE